MVQCVFYMIQVSVTIATQKLSVANSNGGIKSVSVHSQTGR
jgi:hypothetical protein